MTASLHRSAAALLAAAALAAAAGCSAGPGDGTAAGLAAGAAASSPAGSDPVVVEIDSGGRDRSYLLQPAGPGNDGRPGVVVVLHQEGGTPKGVAAETALAALRDRGAVLAYPAGIDGSWAAGKCCGVPLAEGVDDVAFLDAVLDDAVSRTGADPGRSALVGYSSGGMLAYRYVCSRPGRLAAAVVVSGSLEGPCEDGIAVPDVLALHGGKDSTIGWESTGFVKALNLSPRPATDSLEAVAASAGCTPRAPGRESEPASDEVRRWEGCRGGTIEAQVIGQAGHGWANLGASARTREFLLPRLFG